MAEVWPYLPLPVITERLSWATAVHTRRDDESRWTLRPARQVWTLRHNLRAEEAEGARFLFASQPLGEWHVPVWVDATRVTVASGATSATCSTDAEFVAGGKAFLWADCDTWQVVTVGSVGSGSITFSPAAAATYAAVMPLRVCIAREGLQITRLSRDFWTVEGVWEATDNPDLSGATVTSYAGLPYLPCAGAVVEPQPGRITRAAVFVDSGLGPVAVEPARNVVEEAHEATIRESDPAARWALRQTLHVLQGRDAPFWVPVASLPILASTTTTIGVSTAARPTAADWVGAHLDAGGVQREVTAAALVSGRHVLTVATMPSAPTGRVRILRRVRGQSDEVEVRHYRGRWAETRLGMVGVEDVPVAVPETPFAPAWQTFPGNAWLERADPLDGMPNSLAGMLAAVTVRIGAGATDKGLFKSGYSLAGWHIDMRLNSSHQLLVDSGSSSAGHIWNHVTTALPTGVDLLILFGVDPAGVGSKLVVTRLDTGLAIHSSPDASAGTLGGFEAEGWLIGASDQAGINVHTGRMERVMLWQAYSDPTSATVRGYFHSAGALKDPSVASAALGTPIVSIVGSALQTGANAGTGGAFTKDGAGSIVAA